MIMQTRLERKILRTEIERIKDKLLDTGLDYATRKGLNQMLADRHFRLYGVELKQSNEKLK